MKRYLDSSVSQRRRGRTAAALVSALALAATLLVASPAAAIGTDPVFAVLSDGVIPGTGNGVAPAATRAPNGDILVVYNTGGDGAPGAEIKLIRTTDNGATWGTATTFASPTLTGGSMNASLGMTTLANGTILMPFSESVIHTPYTDREITPYVAKSTDSGVTWTGKTTPIALPTPFYMAATYGRIVELPSGDLLLPIYGAKTAPTSPGGAINPTPWEAGVLRSTDGGTTWSSYTQIGIDLISPQNLANAGGPFPSNVTELSIVQQRDGRLLSIIRSDTALGVSGPVYEAWSSDNGATWTTPVVNNTAVQGYAATLAPCSADLSTGQSKIILAGEDFQTSPTEPNMTRLTLQSSFDNGATFVGRTYLTRPAGSGTGGRDIYPDFVSMPDHKLFVVFMRLRGDGPPLLVYNIIQDASGADCQTQYTNAVTPKTTSPTVYLTRTDLANWAWPYSRRQATYSSTQTVGAVAALAAATIGCATTTGAVLVKNGTVLASGSTLAAAGVVNGDTLGVRIAPSTDNVRVGFSDRDKYPDQMQLAQWDDACGTKLAFDYLSRSLGLALTLNPGQSLTSVSLRDSDGANRLVAADYKVWTSTNAKTWTLVTGWTFGTSTVGGRLIHTFSGLSITAPYVKISQAKTDTAFNFIINDTRTDVTITTTP